MSRTCRRPLAGLALALAIALPPLGCDSKGGGSKGRTVAQIPPPRASDDSGAKLFADWPKPAGALVISGQQDGYLEPCGCTEGQKGGLGRRLDLLQRLRKQGWSLAAIDLGSLAHDPATDRGGPEEVRLKFGAALHAPRRDGVRRLGPGRRRPQTGRGRHPDAPGEHPEGPPPRRVGQRRPGRRDRPIRPLPQGRPRRGRLGQDRHHRRARPRGLRRFDRPGQGRAPDVRGPRRGPARRPGRPREGHAGPGPDGPGRPREGDRPGEGVPRLRPGRRHLAASRPRQGARLAERRQDPADLRRPQGAICRRRRPVSGREGPLPLPAGDARTRATTRPRRCGPSWTWTSRTTSRAPASSRTTPRRPFVGGAAGAKFVGAEACRACHPNTVSRWQATGHARAYEGLLKTGPQPREPTPSASRCHTTGFEYESGFRSAAESAHLKGNQCENCHGPASKHAEQPDNADFRKLIALTAERADKNRLCLQCHDEDNSPHFKFETYYPKISHKGLDKYDDPKVHRGDASH